MDVAAPAPAAPPLVSAIIAFLDGERFLGDAIESVIAQTYPHWELLLVDDGSTDGATAIAKRYAAEYPDRIRYCEHEGHRNRGVSASRNVGIAAARGAYVAFLDGDDVWLPDKLAEQVALLEARPDVGAMYGNTLYWCSWSGTPEDAARDYYPPLGVPDGSVFPPGRLLERMLAGRAAVPCVHSFLVRTEVLRRLGGFEERFTGMFEDQAFYAKLMLAEPVLVVHRSWERYRLHEHSICAVARRGGHTRAARLRYLEWLGEYLDSTGAGHATVRAALQRALWPYRHPRLHALARRGARLSAWLREGLRRRVGSLSGG